MYKGMHAYKFLLRIIDLCKTVVEKKVDPFKVEVSDLLQTLREYLPEWKKLEEYGLDIEALKSLVEVIKLQGDWIKHVSSSLYADSLLIAFKIKVLDPKSLAYALLKSWYPIISLDQISSEKWREAIYYWNQLLPLEERYKKLPSVSIPTELIEWKDLFRLELLLKERFEEILHSFWKELLEKAEAKGKLSYWKFILANSFEETVLRAYVTSFLLSYGYATLEIDPTSNEEFLIPLKEPIIERELTVSIPISITYEAWKRKSLER